MEIRDAEKLTIKSVPLLILAEDLQVYDNYLPQYGDYLEEE